MQIIDLNNVVFKNEEICLSKKFENHILTKSKGSVLISSVFGFLTGGATTIVVVVTKRITFKRNFILQVRKKNVYE